MELTKTAQPYAFPAEHVHEWRLFIREPQFSIKTRFLYDTSDINSYREYQSKELTGYEELWYCIKCRHEEKRVVPNVR